MATPISLDHLPQQVLRRRRRYLNTFLFRHGIYDKLVIPLAGDYLGAAGIGLLAEEDGAFNARDGALALRIARHLSAQTRFHVAVHRVGVAHVQLSPRQREVGELAAAVYTNSEIAIRLHITVDTVKKHLSQVLKTIECRNRTELAAAWNRRDAPRGQHGSGVRARS
ncbi:response regulator transcription factor [Streptomyces sp. NPDC094153]|uniref:helix-turn-helix transcriptional regulator n=1 Tax=Streptomyces sp. NPDC094153 TaxID=3366058 RepID=UPI00380BF4BC